MAFKPLPNLDCDITISLGGVNKKTGKPNPTSIEGYYKGARVVEDSKKKSGKSYIYVFETGKGNVGVWGKTDLERKMAGATISARTRVTQSGTVSTPNGDMYKYKVEVDLDDRCDVDGLPTQADDSSNDSDLFEEPAETSLEDEEPALDEVKPAPRAVPARAAAPDAARQAKVQALLNKGRTA